VPCGGSEGFLKGFAKSILGAVLADIPWTWRSQMSEKVLKLKVRRMRERLAAGVNTGSLASYVCTSRTDPTANGYGCPTFGMCPTQPGYTGKKVCVG
jgi:hypothetical protein